MRAAIGILLHGFVEIRRLTCPDKAHSPQPRTGFQCRPSFPEYLQMRALTGCLCIMWLSFLRRLLICDRPELDNGQRALPRSVIAKERMTHYF
jgi:hypothetical protein